MKYIIKAYCNQVPYYVKLYNSTPELRGLKDHATLFDDRSSAEFWKGNLKTRYPQYQFEIISK